MIFQYLLNKHNYYFIANNKLNKTTKGFYCNVPFMAFVNL